MARRCYTPVLLGLLLLPIAQGHAAPAARITVDGYVKSHSLLFDRPLPDHAPEKGRVWVVSNRLRLDFACTPADRLRAGASYDLAPRFQDTGLAGESASTLAVDTRTYRVADLEGQAYPDAPDTAGSFSLHHNLDRLYLLATLEAADVTVGRQPIAWGSARVVNPTDVIAPFVYNALDQEERYGVDAVRVRYPTGDLSEIDLGYVPGEDADFRNSALYVRHKAYAHKTDVSLLLLCFRRHLLLGLDVARALGQAGFWLEGAYVKPDFFEQTDGSDHCGYFRVSAGLDSRLAANTYGFAEVHASSAGATRPEDYAGLLTQPAYRDGAVYLLGRQYVALGVSHQVTPLVTLSGTAMLNANDGSASVSPQLELNVAEDVYLSAGAFIGMGPGPRAPWRYESEFGSYADFAFLSLRAYF